MPRQIRRSSFAAPYSKGSAEKKRVTGKPPAAKFNPSLMKRKGIEEIRQELGLS